MGILSAALAEDFAPPNWAAPESFETRLELMPATASAKGMFLRGVIETCKREVGVAPPHGQYHGFKDYPLKEFIVVAQAAAKLAFPKLTRRQALRRFGAQVYPMFAATMVGSAILSIAGRDWPSTLRLTKRAYGVSIKPGDAELLEVDEGRAIMQLRNVWSFPDSYQVGIFEGAMATLGINGDVLVRAHSMCDADLLILWS